MREEMAGRHDLGTLLQGDYEEGIMIGDKKRELFSSIRTHSGRHARQLRSFRDVAMG